MVRWDMSKIGKGAAGDYARKNVVVAQALFVCAGRHNAAKPGQRKQIGAKEPSEEEDVGFDEFDLSGERWKRCLR